MKKDFECRHHPTHQLLDSEKLENIGETHFLLVPMRLHDFLQAFHPLLKMYYANSPSKIEMIQNRMVRNHLTSFYHMFQLPSLHLQPNFQWHSRATNIEMRSLEERFHFPQDGPGQNLLMVDL